MTHCNFVAALITCFLSADGFTKIDETEIVDHVFNCSDHFPIAVNLSAAKSSLDAISHCSIKDNENCNNYKCIRWDHGDKMKYYELTRLGVIEINQIFDSYCSTMAKYTSLDVVKERFVAALVNADDTW